MQDYIPRQIDINEQLPTVVAKQFDNLSRFIHVQIFDNDLPDISDDEKYFNLENCTARLYVQPKGDDSGTNVAYIDGEVADAEHGIVTFLLPSSITETAGNYEGEIWIYGAETSRPIISTKPFDFVVEKSIRNNTAIEGTSKFTALDNALNAVSDIENDFVAVNHRIDYLSNYVTPQMYGAKGDGQTDDTVAFNSAQNSGYNVYVPAGNYVLTDFNFSTSITWIFQRSNGNQWFADVGGAKILTSTSTTISHGAKIYNLVIKYNGSESETKNRPVCLKMLSHFCEIHGFFESNWYIGMDFGKGAEGHCDYTRIYDAYCWYNYFCGVRLDGDAANQINFISFYDCNIGANGVDVHDRNKAPDTSRGYGFYIATCNSVAINNADLSANETCGIYIANDTPYSVTRGLSVPIFYAEHNKYCDVYYKNGASYASTRTDGINIATVYSYHDNTDLFFAGVVHTVYGFIPPTVKLLNTPRLKFVEKTSIMLDCADNLSPINIENNLAKDFTFFGKKGKSYLVLLDIMGLETGNLVLQPAIYKTKYNQSGAQHYYSYSKIEQGAAFTINITNEETKKIAVFVSFPSDLETPLGLYGFDGYGANCIITGGSIYDADCGIIPSDYTIISDGMGQGRSIPAGAKKINNSDVQIYSGNNWVTI